MKLYAKLQKPLMFKNRQEAQNFWKKNVEGYAEAVNELEKLNVDYNLKVNEATSNVRNYLKEWKKNNPTTEFIRIAVIKNSMILKIVLSMHGKMLKITQVLKQRNLLMVIFLKIIMMV